MLRSDAPGIFVVEDLLEVEEILKVFAPVFVPFDENADVDEGEDEFTYVIGRMYAPILEDGTRKRPEAIDREAPRPVGQLPPGYVPPLLLPRDHVVERVEQKDVGAAVVAGVPLLQPRQQVDRFTGVHSAKLHLRGEVANHGVYSG